MAVTIVYRPERAQLINSSPTAAGVQILSGNNPAIGLGNNNAVVFNVAHGLTSGQILYIKSRNDYYNGFWFASVQTANAFYLAEHPTAPRLEYYGYDTEVDYYTSNLGVTDYTKWSCVHLPIIYKLSNTLWPVNSVDTVRTMTVTNVNGFCAIAASGDIKATGSAAKLEFVKITNAGDYNGVYQIISYTNDTTFSIDLAYSSAADTALTAGNIQYYYNNYVAKVEVWGGLNVEHEFYSVEPYELLATLDLIPDEDGICKFSISDILKQNIAIKNNLLLGTLPNNLDAFTKFFIKYGEEYDDSDGTTLSRSTVSYTSDYSSFQGYAVNAKLPFKNVYSGALSEYIGIPKTFLTDFDQPTIFPSQYFDLSFIITDTLSLMPYEMRSQRYLAGVLQSTSYDVITVSDDGVYRFPVEATGTEDRIDAAVVVRNTASTNNSLRNTAGSTSNTYDFFVPAGLTPPATYNLSAQMGGSSAGDLASAALSYNYDDGTTEAIVSAARTTDGTTTTGVTALPVASKNIVSVTVTLIIGDVPPSGGAFNATVSGSFVISGSDVAYSEVKQCDVDQTCLPANASGINLQWLNNLSGFDSWYFKAYNDHLTDIRESGTAKKNLFPGWPDSGGEFADTVEYETHRISRDQIVVRSQNLTLDQLNTIKRIKTSLLVQIVNSIYDRRTVLVDANSFKVYTEGQQTTTPYTIEFTITYTDDVPSQSV
jgi:hypothetical protein